VIFRDVHARKHLQYRQDVHFVEVNRRERSTNAGMPANVPGAIPEGKRKKFRTGVSGVSAGSRGNRPDGLPWA
jgi:hypothetical protein